MHGSFRQGARSLRRQAKRMADIVGQLLNYGRRGTGRHVQVALHDLLNRVVREVETEDQRIRFGPQHACAVVHGDPVRLELAISNLIRNALRHADRDVEVCISKAGGRVLVRVCDDGEGVADEDRTQIFQPFFTRQPPGCGTGLGLAIVASVMHEHDGEVCYEAAPGGGSRFVLSLPDATGQVSR